MSSSRTMVLIGVGTSGCRLAHRVGSSFDSAIRCLNCDTDATSGQLGQDFVLLGGNRLAGRGAGGDIVAARMAVEESVGSIDPNLEGARLAVIVTSLGGGTGGGATLEILKHLASRGIPSIVFATLPFTFEGEGRQRNSRGIMRMIEDAANASFFVSMDQLTKATDNMKAAFAAAEATLAESITFFWRLVESPGYLRLDAERLRHVLSRAGRGRFATVTVQGDGRAEDAVDRLLRSESLANGANAARSILCGILAGDDLRLTEVGIVANGIRKGFGETAQFELATVNDEYAFAGRMSVVAMLFEAGGDADAGKPKKELSVLAPGAQNRGRFHNSESTLWHGENVDEPTYLRKNITLDF